LSKRETSLVPVGEDPVASSPEAQRFVEAVEKGDMNTAFKVYKSGNDGLKECCGKYLVSFEKPELVKLVKGARDDIKTWMLNMVLTYADQALIDEVSAEIKPTDDLLRRVASSADLVCKTDKFIYLIGRITGKGDQEWAVRLGVGALFDADKSEYLDPLLFAPQNEPSLDPNLTNTVIQQAFRKSPLYIDDRMLYAKRFFDHPAVSAEDYSDALGSSYRSNDPKNEFFQWLLIRADVQDLEKARSSNWFSNMSSEFQDAVTKVSPVNISKTRQEMGRLERIATIKKATDGLVAGVLIKLIIEYYLEQ